MGKLLLKKTGDGFLPVGIIDDMASSGFPQGKNKGTGLCWSELQMIGREDARGLGAIDRPAPDRGVDAVWSRGNQSTA
jgi:hypothetical protein